LAQSRGFTHFETSKIPGWSLDGEFKDPRNLGPTGQFQKNMGHYKGLYINGDNVLFSYAIGDSDVLELPGFEQVDDHPVFTRTFNLSPTEETLSLRVLQVPENAEIEMVSISNSKEYLLIQDGNNTRVVGLQGIFNSEAKWRILNGHLILDLPQIKNPLYLNLPLVRF
jgi:hypothetical protein